MTKLGSGYRAILSSIQSQNSKLRREFGAYLGVAVLPFMRRAFSSDGAGHNQSLAVVLFLGVFWIYRSVGIIFEAGDHDATKANPAMLVGALLLIAVSFLMPSEGTNVSDLGFSVAGYLAFLFLWVRYDTQQAAKHNSHTNADPAPGMKAIG